MTESKTVIIPELYVSGPNIRRCEFATLSEMLCIWLTVLGYDHDLWIF